MLPVAARWGFFFSVRKPIPGAAAEENAMEHVRSGTVVHSPEGARKKAEGKKRPSPQTPYREKGKGKETRRDYTNGNPKTARAYAGETCAGARGGASCEQPGGERTSGQKRFKLAGAAADEILALFGDRDRDRAIWAFYCYHHDAGLILEKAREIASCRRQGEIKWPARAFQRWLVDTFPKGGAK